MRLDKGSIVETVLRFHLVVFILHSNFTQYHRFTLSLGKPKMPIGHFHHARFVHGSLIYTIYTGGLKIKSLRDFISTSQTQSLNIISQTGPVGDASGCSTVPKKFKQKS